MSEVSRKKSQAASRLYRMQKAALKNVCVVHHSILNSGEIKLANSKSLKLFNSDVLIADGITKTPWQWTIYLSIFLDNGRQQYTKSLVIKPDNKYLHSSLIDVLQEHHVEFLKEQNEQHIVGYGWLAFPLEPAADFDEKSAQAIYDATVVFAESTGTEHSKLLIPLQDEVAYRQEEAA